MQLVFYPTVLHLQVLAEIFANLSAGYIGLMLITPLPDVNPLIVIRNLALAIAFYFLAVALRKVR